MSEAGSLKILFVINPGAGTKAKTGLEDIIRDYFKNLSYIIEYFTVDGKNGAIALKAIIEKIRPHRVVAVGGDGTVSLVAMQLAGSGMVMGILPAGSANGMARELNIPDDPLAALDIIVNGRVSDSDLIAINGKERCLHMSDIGLNAQLIKYFDEGRLRGKIGYARVIFKTLWNKQRMQVMIHTETETIKRTAFMVVLANASKYGTGAVINPDGAINDGFFEVIVVKKLVFGDLLKMLFKPQPLNPSNVQGFKAKAITVDTQRKVHFQIDGEYMGKVNHIEARILHHQIKLILPAERSGQ